VFTAKVLLQIIAGCPHISFLIHILLHSEQSAVPPAAAPTLAARSASSLTAAAYGLKMLYVSPARWQEQNSTSFSFLFIFFFIIML